ncbi:CpsD/CapB family tyrosine-protein kinase [Myxococcota bacterium]|nr:CpsD/CapB family tyrosine-protein kinase [Myxococcota bacterium]
MAKHYEALQKAEEERRKRTGRAQEPAPQPFDIDPPSRSQRSSSQGLLKNIQSRFRRPLRKPSTANEVNKRRISILQPDSFAAEQFRTLRGRIDSLATQREIKSVALTSANPDEGKSTASINLAAVTSMSVGRKVVLVDCDLRQPKIHRSLGIEPVAGLAEVLTGQASIEDAIVQADGVGLDVLGVRNTPSNPSELLASREMRQLVADLVERYDQVVLDTPACLGLPDAKTVTELADGVVLVVRADVTPREDVETVLEILDRSRLLGMVLNGVEMTRRQYGYY